MSVIIVADSSHSTMYQQPNHSFESARRLSSNNPFRQDVTGSSQARSTNSTHSSNSAFEEWVQKNKQLIESSDEDEPVVERPKFPTQSRTGSDSNVNYRKMSSNNPFASAMTGEYKHHRAPPPPPPSGSSQSKTHSTREKKPSAPPPPSYEEAAGPEAVTREYPQEKPPSSSSHTSSRSSRPHRSQSDSARHRSDRERRHHHKSSRNRSPSKKKPAAVKPKNLDTIDKLDVSAFFGGRFHHDGPFDACTPHRNKNEKNAPVMAFPADGPNTSMKAFGPGFNNNDRMNLAFGYGDDQNDIVGRVSTQKVAQPPVPKTNWTSNDPQSTYTPKLNPSVVAFDANEKSAPVHGSTTAGLGSSTFLDGAPAPRGDEFLNVNSNGLGRKKSLVQRLRKNSSGEAVSRRSSNDNSGEYGRSSFGDDEMNGGSSLLRRVKSLKVGRK